MVNGCRYPVIQRSSERRGERRGFSSPKSRIFANIGYEGVVNTHQQQTGINFSYFLMGFRNGSPLNFRNAARFARL